MTISVRGVVSIDDMSPRVALALPVIVAVVFAAAACGSPSGAPAASNPAAREATASGAIIGAIRVGGGPAGEGRRRGGGLVTVFSREGFTVARERVPTGHDFRFRLAPGSYRLGFGRHGNQDRAGCRRDAVVVRAGRTTHSDLWIGCDWD